MSSSAFIVVPVVPVVVIAVDVAAAAVVTVDVDVVFVITWELRIHAIETNGRYKLQKVKFNSPTTSTTTTATKETTCTFHPC